MVGKQYNHVITTLQRKIRASANQKNQGPWTKDTTFKSLFHRHLSWYANKKKIIWIYSMFRRVGVYFQLPQVHFHNPNSGPNLPNMEGTNTHHNWRPKEPTQLRPWKKRTRPGVLLRPNLHQWSPSGVGDKSTQEHQICISFRFWRAHNLKRSI